jgi:hypothetical protein
LVAHLQFFQTHIAKQKNPKEPPSKRTKTDQNGQTNHDRKKTTKAITAPTQKAGFSAPQTHLWLIKVWFSVSTFVVKIATFAKPETVSGHCKKTFKQQK